MSVERKQLSKKLRFEVFKRDSFTCQYCGKKSPDVVLHIDHIQPLALDGTDDILNLITSCVDCNLGKGARTLDDSSVLSFQRTQLEALQERREQLDMMLEWQKGLVNLELETVDRVCEFWISLVGIGLNEYGRNEIGNWLKKNPVEDVLSAMRQAVSAKLVVGADEDENRNSVVETFHCVPKFLTIIRGSRSEPFLRDAHYTRGILRRRFGGKVNDNEAKDLILRSLNSGSTPESEQDWAKKASSYWVWKTEMHRVLADQEGDS